MPDLPRLVADVAACEAEHLAPTAAECAAAVAELGRAAGAFRGRRILWVDDNLAGNAALRRLFEALGARIDTARSTGEALALPAGHDLAITDMTRATEEPAATAGLTLVAAFPDLPVIICSQSFEPGGDLPGNVLATTRRDLELIHHVVAALDR